MSSRTAKVKICGIKEEATLHGMRGLPVDYIGFMFAKSRRQIEPEQASKLQLLSTTLPMASGHPPRTVGVFVNPTIAELRETLAKVSLDIVQLHGQETPAFCKDVQDTFDIEVWRALPIHDDLALEGGSSGAERLADYRGTVSAILLDTVGGGTGRAFCWDVIPAYQEAASDNDFELFVAGGLTPDNVGELITSYRPQGVDISSGVETDGVKDIHKIIGFSERVSRS